MARAYWLLLWQDLEPFQQKEVRAAFVNWRHDPTSVTFEAWAEKHAFYFKKDGHLASCPKRCEPAFLADPKPKKAIGETP